MNKLIDTKGLKRAIENIKSFINKNYITEVTYEELVELRNNNNLIPGKQYRIIDYITTTVQENTRSAGHQFDIIVTALNDNTLSEMASAIKHKGDTYFTNANANLSAWQIWYNIDNDVNKFAWADEENGKGVIYRMIDDNNNDCSFDFKNIMFLRRDEEFYYTFFASWSDCSKDNSFNVHNNQIMSFYCAVENSNNCKVGKHCYDTINITESENIIISDSCRECYIYNSTNIYIGIKSENIELSDCRDFSIGNHVGRVTGYDSINCYVEDYAHNISFEASVSCKASFGVYEAYFNEKQLVTCNEKVYFFDIEKGNVELNFEIQDLGGDCLNLHIVVENFCGPLSFRTEEWGELDYEVSIYRGDEWLDSTYGKYELYSNESMRNFERDEVLMENILWEDLIVGETLKVVWNLLDPSSNAIVTYEQDVVYNGRSE